VTGLTIPPRHKGRDKSPALYKAGKKSYKRYVEFSCSLHGQSAGDYSRLSALSL
jgi:hypothetical protein